MKTLYNFYNSTLINKLKIKYLFNLNINYSVKRQNKNVITENYCDEKSSQKIKYGASSLVAPSDGEVWFDEEL